MDEAEAKGAWDWGEDISAPASTISHEESRLQYRPPKDSCVKEQPIEMFSKLRIQNRTISTIEMTEQMEGRTFYSIKKLPSVQKTLENEKVDWVTIGILQTKSTPKATKKGDHYAIWTLSDLTGCSVSVFLFGNAYETHWKEMEGSIIAVINPGIIAASEKGKFSLKTAKGCVLAKLGMSMDFATCKGTNVATGTRCKNAVNVTQVDFVIYYFYTIFL